VAYGSQDLSSPGRLGEVRLLHQGLSARAILAFLPDTEQSRYRRYIAARHPALLPELDGLSLREQLQAARRQGFAVEMLDHGPRYGAIAMPLRDTAGEAFAAILVSGPVATGKDGSVVQPAWCDHVLSLEASVRSSPGDFVHPYAHLDADDISMHLPGTTEGAAREA
jgi:DNA-binding IclR family transcriptional regulator